MSRMTCRQLTAHLIATGKMEPMVARPCPSDFDFVLVNLGRKGCERWYQAARPTINRWLEERGKQRLIDRRAAYVIARREDLQANQDRGLNPLDE